MDLGEFVTRLGYEIFGQDELRKYQAGLDDLSHSVGEVAKGMALLGSVVAGVTTAVIGGVSSFVAPVAKDLDELAKASDRVGVGLEALQELRFAASQGAGVEENTLDLALQRFSRRIGEAANGSGELKGIVEELGIQLRNTDGTLKSTEVLFGEFADAIKGAKSEQEALRIAFKSFDSEGAALVTLMKEGRDGVEAYRERARELGLVLGKDATEASTKFADAQERIGKIWSMLRARLALEVMPSVTQFLEKMEATFERRWADGSIPETIDFLGKGLTAAFKGATVVAERAATHFGYLFDTLRNMDPNRQQQIAAAIGSIGTALAAIKFPRVFGLMLVGLGIDDILTHLEGGESYFGDFVQWLQDVTGLSPDAAENIGLISSAIAGLFLSGLGRPLFWTGVRSAALLVAGIASVFTGAGAAIILAAAAAALIATFWDDIKAAVEGLPLEDVMTSMEEAFKTGDWSGVGQQIMDSLLEGMKIVGDRIQEWFRGLFEIEMPDWVRELIPAGQETVGAAPGGSITVGGGTGTVGGGTGSSSSAANITRSSGAQAYRDQQERAQAPSGRLTAADIQAAYERYRANTARMDPAAAAVAVMNDQRQDNRDQSVTNNIGGTTVNVQSVSQVAGASARAVGDSVTQANRRAATPARVQQNPHF